MCERERERERERVIRTGVLVHLELVAVDVVDGGIAAAEVQYRLAHRLSLLPRLMPLLKQCRIADANLCARTVFVCA